MISKSNLQSLYYTVFTPLTYIPEINNTYNNLNVAAPAISRQRGAG
jgi:hypothetical protein